jgi:hypothetical protein
LTSIVRSKTVGSPRGWQLRRGPGVGDHDVQPTKPLHGQLHGILDLRAVADVTLRAGRVVAVARQGRQQVALEPHQRHPRASGISLLVVAAPIPRAAPVMNARLPARALIDPAGPVRS